MRRPIDRDREKPHETARPPVWALSTSCGGAATPTGDIVRKACTRMIEDRLEAGPQREIAPVLHRATMSAT